MRAIEGKNVTVEGILDNTGAYRLFACSTDVSFYLEEEQVEITTQESGRWREFDGGLSTWGMTLRGVTHVAPTTIQITVFDVLTETMRRNGLDVRVVFEDDEDNLKVLLGKVRMPRIGINAGATGFATDEIEFVGNGSLQIETIIDDAPENPNEVKSYEYVASGSETSIQFANLIDRQILGVWRTYPLDVITTGTPTELQAKYDPVVGEVLFAPSAPLNAGELILILYK